MLNTASYFNEVVMQKLQSLIIITFGAVLLLLVYVLPSLPKTLSGWFWLFGLALPFCFILGFGSDIIVHYYPKNSSGNASWWHRVIPIALTLVIVAISLAFFLHLVGMVS